MRARRFLRPLPVRTALGVLLAFGASGCAAKAQDEDTKTNAPSEDDENPQSAQPVNPNMRALRVDTARCSMKGQRADQKDLNHDGRADLVSLYSGEGTTLTCRQADFNFDGRHDAYFHYDEKGVLAREQFDLDYDGRIDIGRTFKDGKLVLDEQDTNRDGFVDAWRRYDKGRLLRIETDRDGDGRADMFAYYVAGRVDRIGYDVNGDGRVDQWDHDAARRVREAAAIRRENTDDVEMPGTGSDEFVDEAAQTSQTEGEDAASKPATAAPERTGGGSLKPKAGAGEPTTVEAGDAKTPPGQSKSGAGKEKAAPAKPAKPASPAKPQKPGVQKPSG